MENRFKALFSFLFRFIRVILVLAVAGGLAFWLYESRTQPEKKEPKPILPSVRTLEVHPQSQTMTVDLFGTVVPRKQVKIAAEVPGRIEYVNPAFVEGGEIKAQEVLIRIDQRSYHLEKEGAAVRVSQARQDIESLNQEITNLKNDADLAKENVALALKDLGRIKTLTQNQFASETNRDKAEQQHLAAKIQWQAIHNRLLMTVPLMELKKSSLAMAQVDFDRADLALKKTEIRSGFDGFVLDKMAEAGEYVNPGQPLGSVYEQGALDVEVNVPLEQLEWIEDMFKQGEMPRAQVSPDHVDRVGEKRWNARVARIKARIDEKTRTLPMTLEIQEEETGAGQGPRDLLSDLRPGTFVKCRILGQTHDNIFVVPRHLLRSDHTLLVVVDQRLEKRKVSPLRTFEENVYINAGLNNGDLIIVSPLPNPIEGMGLTLKENGQ